MTGVLVIDPRPRPRRCDEKNRYKNRRQADRVARRQSRLSGEPITRYYCPLHICWHIGHPIGWRAAQARDVERAGEQP